MLKGYRTLIFNAAAVVPLLAEPAAQLVTGGALAPFIPPQYMPLYTLAVAVGNIYLRTITSTKIGGQK